MPVTFTRTPTEIERREPGIGGKPPVDQRPTGGGGGGGDENWKNGPHGPRERLNRVRTALFLFLAADLLFFVLLVALFFARQSGMRMDPHTHLQVHDWHPIQLPPVLYLNTFVLILSSLTMELARRRIFHEIDVMEEWLGLGRPALDRTLPWVGATFTLGLLFLGGQWLAWRQLTQQGFAFNRWSATPASYFFYLITGAHAAHLALGILGLLSCLTLIRLFKAVELRQIAIDSAAWYWHFMGGTWVLLLAILAFGQ
jgi:cytochrome c oxidase subunit 3